MENDMETTKTQAAEEFVATATTARDEAKAAVEPAKAALDAAKAKHTAAKAAAKADPENQELADEVLTSGTEEALAKGAWEAAKEAAKVAATALKDAKAAVTAARKADREAKEAEKAANKVERVTQNGQTQPLPDSTSGHIWAECDKVSAERKAPAALAEVLPQLEARGFKTATIRAAYSHWRKFHGVTGRVMSQEQLDAKAKAEEEKAAKAAAAAAAKEAKAKEAEAAAAAA